MSTVFFRGTVDAVARCAAPRSLSVHARDTSPADGGGADRFVHWVCVLQTWPGFEVCLFIVRADSLFPFELCRTAVLTFDIARGVFTLTVVAVDLVTIFRRRRSAGTRRE